MTAYSPSVQRSARTLSATTLRRLRGPEACAVRVERPPVPGFDQGGVEFVLHSGNVDNNDKRYAILVQADRAQPTARVSAALGTQELQLVAGETLTSGDVVDFKDAAGVPLPMLGSRTIQGAQVYSSATAVLDVPIDRALPVAVPVGLVAHVRPATVTATRGNPSLSLVTGSLRAGDVVDIEDAATGEALVFGPRTLGGVSGTVYFSPATVPIDAPTAPRATLWTHGARSVEIRACPCFLRRRQVRGAAD